MGGEQLLLQLLHGELRAAQGASCDGRAPRFTCSHPPPRQVLARVRDIRDQLAQLAERAEVQPQANLDSSDITPIQKALLSGFFMSTATLQKGGESYRALKQNATVHVRELAEGQGGAIKRLMTSERRSQLVPFQAGPAAQVPALLRARCVALPTSALRRIR